MEIREEIGITRGRAIVWDSHNNVPIGAAEPIEFLCKSPSIIKVGFPNSHDAPWGSRRKRGLLKGGESPADGRT